MWWNDGWGGWWLFMPLLGLAFWVAVIWIVVSLVRDRSGPATGTGGERPADPEEILAQRYARGEIDETEYHRRVDTLRSARRAEGQR